MIDYGTLIKDGIIQAEKDYLLYRQDDMAWFKEYQSRGCNDWNSVGSFYVLLMHPFSITHQRVTIVTSPDHYKLEVAWTNNVARPMEVQLGLTEEEYFQRSLVEDLSLLSWEDANDIHELFMNLMRVYREYE